MTTAHRASRLTLPRPWRTLGRGAHCPGSAATHNGGKPHPDERRRRGGGVRRTERYFVAALALLVLFIAAGWTAAMVDMRAQKRASAAGTAGGVGAAGGAGAAGTAAAPAAPVARSVAGALLDPEASSTAYLDDAALEFLNPLRGESGKLQMAFRKPE